MADHHLTPHLDRQLDALFETLSGNSTPRHNRSTSSEPVLAEHLVSGLSSGCTTPLRPYRSDANFIPTRDWTDGQGLDLVFVQRGKQQLVHYDPLSMDDEPINLILYGLEGHPLPMKVGPGFMVRFTLLEWDDRRLDRLAVAIRRSVRNAADAHITRLLLHDDHWAWRMQVTIYLGPFRPWSQTDAVLDPAGARRRAAAGLIAAL